MAEAKSKYLNRILENRTEPEEEKAFTAERQHTAQAFNLHVERRDGRQAEGFAWSHYGGYHWTDEGDKERLIVVFGTRAIEIEGFNLGELVAEIREGKLNGIRELASREVQLHQAEPDKPVIASVRAYPDFEEVFKSIKGEEENDAKHARRVQR